jgi:hypothetical protein
MTDENVRALRGSDWERAPRNGSTINVEFSTGEIAHARWDSRQAHWAFVDAKLGLVAMHLKRRDLPTDWWPIV